MNTLYHTLYESPLGPMLLLGTKTHLRGLYFIGQKRQAAVPEGAVESKEPFAEVIRQLDAYFKGERSSFDVPVEFEGTPFQETVWKALQQIPHGKTITYGQLAQNIGNPKAVRAVGLANGCNRISIIVPCHRVIGADGSATGYAGGLERKSRLLALEAGETLPGL